MLNLKELGTEAFDYFPAEMLEVEVARAGLEAEYQDHITKIPHEHLYDTSHIEVSTKVIVGNRKGVITNYHNTELGIRNGGIEVDFGNHKDVYYPHQVKKALASLGRKRGNTTNSKPKQIARSNQLTYAHCLTLSALQ